MGTPHAILILSGLLLLAIAVQPLARKLHIPFSALLSATDPVAVVALLRQMGVSERLALLMEGESLFNDATAIVIFGVFLAMATGVEGPMSVSAASMYFLQVFFGGLLVGTITGLLFIGLSRLLRALVTTLPPGRVMLLTRTVTTISV